MTKKKVVKKEAVKFITLREFAEKYNKDASYVNKVAHDNKVKLLSFKRKKDGKIVKAATLQEWNALLKKIPSLSSKELGKKDITLTKAAKILSMDKSNLMKFAKRNKISFHYRSTGKSRSVNCLTKGDVAKLQKIIGGPLPTI